MLTSVNFFIWRVTLVGAIRSGVHHSNETPRIMTCGCAPSVCRATRRTRGASSNSTPILVWKSKAPPVTPLLESPPCTHGGLENRSPRGSDRTCLSQIRRRVDADCCLDRPNFHESHRSAIPWMNAYEG